jgi:hypothetical protein
MRGDFVSINVHNYIPELINLDNDSYSKFLDDLIQQLSLNEPYRWMIKGSINNASKPFVNDPLRDNIFQKLLDFNLTLTAYETFEQVIQLLPSPVEQIH